MEAFSASHDLLGKSVSAYEHLRRSIVQGQLRPGRRLSATDLADVFHISVTPVREALVRLAAEGFVAWEASRGYFTKAFTVSEQDDLHEVLGMAITARLSRPVPEPRALLEAVATFVPTGEEAQLEAASARYAELLDQFGAALAQSAGNQALQSILVTALDRTQLVRHLDLEVPGRLAPVAARIRALASAVLASDVARAAGLVAEHLSQRRARLPQLVDCANKLAQRATYP
jgi:DNA-binding GntR family transcriptional regulator